MGFFNKIFGKKDKEQEKAQLDAGLQKTKQGLWEKITHSVAGRSQIDEDVLDDLEEAFVTSDVGVDTTLKIIDRIKERVKRDKYVSTSELTSLLCDEISQMLVKPDEALPGDDFVVPAEKRPHVILVVGVNGVGKTTTIGKLAYQYRMAGNTVLLGAADTFRAAAISQLELWAERAGVPLVRQQMGSDPAAVTFDTVSRAKAQDTDVVIIDTAGRLHNRVNLMNELTKIKNQVARVLPEATLEVLLVLDGSTGQNAYEQARQFIAATDVNALAITKLDGTAKGGVVIGISDQFQVPVRYIGIGEAMDDLQVFHAAEFVESLFGDAIK